MKTLDEALSWAAEKKVAIGHFNIANAETLKAIFEQAVELTKEVGHKLPIIIGLSESERGFLGTYGPASLIKAMRERYHYPIFINADHTHDIALAKEAVDADYDSVIIDGTDLSFRQNVLKAKRLVKYARAKNPGCLIEAEIGYIGSGSDIKDKLPEGVAITKDTVTSVAEALEFVEETGVDLLAPAVGNIHGMLKNAKNPKLIIERIEEIAKATRRPLVLHGGSGVSNADFKKAIRSGIRIIHISTELRRAYREALEKSLKENKKQLAPYKIMKPVVEEMKRVVKKRLKLFNNL